MISEINKVSPTFFIIVLLGLSPLLGKTVTVGLVLDGPNTRCFGDQSQFQKEVKELIGAEHTVHFPQEKILIGDWNPKTISTLFTTLMDDQEVDIVITMGSIGSNVAISEESFVKPVIAPFVSDRELQNAPFQKGTSGVHNLNYLDVPHNVERDIQFFKEMTDCKELLLFVNNLFVEATPNFSRKITALAKKLNCRIHIVPVDTLVEDALATLPDEGDAAYITPLLHLSVEEFDKLVQGLIKRNLPSFSFVGEQEVAKGIMTSLNPDPCVRIHRRVGVNIQRILMGDDPANFPVHYSIGEKLTFNMETARAIAFEPAWHIYNQAHFVGKIRPEKGDYLTLKEAVLEGVDKNLDLAAKKHEASSVKQEVLSAQSKLMPRVELGSSATLVEEEMAEASMGNQSQYSATASASVTQVLFSEPANVNISIQKHVYAASQDQLLQKKLDVAMAVSEAYFNVLRTQTFERIRQKNVKRSQRYLELAKIRVSVGTADKSEMYRWESQIASNLMDLISANAQRNQAEIQLNRLLTRLHESPFQLKENSFDQKTLLRMWDHYNRCFATKSSFQAFREFMVTEALQNSPEISALDEIIAMEKRMLRAANRVTWIPTLALQGRVDNTYYRSGKGTNPPPGFPTTDDVNWVAGVSLTFPIYTGAEVFAKNKARREILSQKELERKSITHKIEQLVRSQLHAAGASFAGINQATKAADAANKGLDMVSDAYGQGIVSIVDLMDGQTQAQIAQEAATDVLFDYLLKLMQVQRAAGQFDFFRDSKGNEDFQKRLNQYINKNGNN